jgi:hypothetical protein
VKRRVAGAVVVAVATAVAGCNLIAGSYAVVSDAGVSDASVADADVTDSGVTDVVVSDAGVADAGANDADAGIPVASEDDAGVYLAFDAGGVWSAFEAADIVAPTAGFSGGVFDGRFVYFATQGLADGGADGGSAVLLRYDTAVALGSPDTFNQVDRWQAASLGSLNVNPTTGAPDGGVTASGGGFLGGVFDGRYVYFCPYEDSAGHPTSVVVQYDTAIDAGNNSAFTYLAAYRPFDLREPYANADGGSGYDWPLAVGCAGALFVPPYVYFVPSGGPVVPRYDTRQAGELFHEYSSWSYLNLTQVIGPTSSAFGGAAFDGRYLYLTSAQGTSQVVRYDTANDGGFGEGEAWSFAFLNGASSQPNGYRGAVYAAGQVYLAPAYDDGGAGNNASAAAFSTDPTSGLFAANAAAGVYDTARALPGSGGDLGTVFDGRYVYFVPSAAFVDGGQTPDGLLTRYDTTRSFTDDQAWSGFDLGTLAALGAGPTIGFRGAVFDGEYIYFVPSFGRTFVRFRARTTRGDAGTPTGAP